METLQKSYRKTSRMAVSRWKREALNPHTERDFVQFGKTETVLNKGAKRLPSYSTHLRFAPDHLYPHMWRHSRSMQLYRNGMPLPLAAEWLGHARMDTTRKFYANAVTTMKKEAIDKAASDINPLYSDEYDIEWEDDEELLKRLYCLK